MRRIARAGAVAVFCVMMACAASPLQTEAGDSGERFEVASVRPVAPGVTSVSPWGSDLFIARNISLHVLIGLAYHMDDRNIEGLKENLGARQFDVEARAEGQKKRSQEEMEPLLQNLLHDRFHFAAHRATRQERGYALVIAKGGPKLKSASTSGGELSILPTGLRGSGVSMEILAGMLARPLASPVEDRTGLSGSYDVTLQYRTMDADDSSLPSIFTALEEQLGLTVRRAEVPVPILIVDHVDPEPTPQ